MKACPECGYKWPKKLKQRRKKQKGDLYQCEGCLVCWDVVESSPGDIRLIEKVNASELIFLKEKEYNKKVDSSFFPAPAL